MDRLGMVPAAIIPVDDDLKRYDLEQKPLFNLPDTSRAVMAVNDLMKRLLKADNVLMKRG
jgi:CO dehydrogenase nickel-insertion accessory protein CooC1